MAARSSCEVVERKSRFISVLAPASSEEEAFSLLAEVRAANPGARHNVWAYLLRDGRERCSDDGEPQKTAGLPTLEALRASGLADVALVTTRYFGGVLLGTGGLVRAYAAAAQGAVAAAEPVEHALCVEVSCRIPYNLFEQVRRLASELGGKAGQPEFSHEVRFGAVFRAGTERAFMDAVRDLARSDVCEAGEPAFRAL